MTVEAAQPPYLTDEEIAEICKPLKLAYAQRRHLARLGMLVKTKADGRPLVARAEFVRVMTGAPAPTTTPAAASATEASATAPNVLEFERWAAERAAKRKHGTKTQGR